MTPTTYTKVFTDNYVYAYSDDYGLTFECPMCQTPVEVFVKDLNQAPEVDCPSCKRTYTVQVGVVVSYDVEV